MPQETIKATSAENNVRAESFKNQWLNFGLYLPNFLYRTKRRVSKSIVCNWLIPDKVRLKGNREILGGTATSTQWLANGNEYRTDFIELDKADLVDMLRKFPTQSGFTSDELPGLRGTYRSEAPRAGSTLDKAGRRYFYRGLLSSDVLRMLLNWNLLV